MDKFWPWLFSQGSTVVVLIIFIWLLLKFILPEFKSQAAEHRASLEKQVTEAGQRARDREEVFVTTITTVASSHERVMEKISQSLDRMTDKLHTWRDKE